MSEYAALCPKCGAFRKKLGKCGQANCPVPRSTASKIFWWFAFGLFLFILGLGSQNDDSGSSTSPESEIRDELSNETSEPAPTPEYAPPAPEAEPAEPMGSLEIPAPEVAEPTTAPDTPENQPQETETAEAEISETI